MRSALDAGSSANCRRVEIMIIGVHKGVTFGKASDKAKSPFATAVFARACCVLTRILCIASKRGAHLTLPSLPGVLTYIKAHYQ